MEELIQNLDEEFKNLQDNFALIDLLNKSNGGLLLEVLLKKILPLEFRMEPDTHKTPHLHVSYGIHKHAASYSLLDGEPIAGSLSSRHDRKAKEWIEANQTVLMQIWEELKRGNQNGYESLIKTL